MKQPLAPEVDRDWRLTTALALGEIHDSSELLKRKLRARTEVQEGISTLLCKFWSHWGVLSPAAQEELYLGTWLAYFCGQTNSMRSTYLRKAAVSWATALELELTDKVFVCFRNAVLQNPNLQLLARQALVNEKRDRFGKFLLDNIPLTLGQMVGVFCPRDEGIMKEFRSWLEQEHPLIAGIDVSQLNQIADFRNAAVHAVRSNRTLTDPEQIMRLCRNVIELIV